MSGHVRTAFHHVNSRQTDGTASPMADDRPEVCSTLAQFLHDILPQVVHEPDVVIELRFPPSLSATESPAQSAERTAVVTLKRAEDSHAIVRDSMQSRASGCLNHVHFQRIKETLATEALRLGQRCSPESLQPMLDNLSQREWDVLLGLVRGATCKQIAAAMKIGLPTVSKHRVQLFRKLQLNSVSEVMTLFWNWFSDPRTA